MTANECSNFRKADLHVHTPVSACYSEKSVTPEQIVNTAIANGLDVIAITDHNSVAAIDGFRQAASGTGLFIFPGIELSTRGGHILAIFDTDTPVGDIDNFLDRIGIAQGERGDAITMASGSTEEVCQQIEENGGIAIAAHIERWPSGFTESSEPRRVKMRIHGNQHLYALEITVPQNKEMWNAGKVRGYPKKYACIQGSDAHALADIGRRPVYIHMEKVELAALKAAFLDYQTRIVFPDEYALG